MRTAVAVAQVLSDGGLARDGMAGVGVRFLSELERGKPTLQIGLAIAVLQLFGLELYVRARGES